MPELWMDVDTAIAEAPVNLMPLISDSDFKTRQTSVAFNAAGMDLVWNFVTSDGAQSQTPVVPTSGGVHDWINQGDAMYSLEIPASGGTINNDTEGVGWFSGVATGILPWRGPTIGFRAAALNTALSETGSGLLDKLAVVAVGNLTVTSPVTEDGTVEIVQGDDYVDSQGRALTFTIEDYTGPSVSGMTVAFAVMETVDYDAGTGTAALTVAGSVSMVGADAVFKVELSAAQTAALDVSPPDNKFNYTYQLRATKDSKLITEALGAMTVKRKVAT